MQAAQNLFAGEQGVAYIPMPKGRGFTPRLVSGTSNLLTGSEKVFIASEIAMLSHPFLSILPRE